jgi:hypothetical protein
MSTPDLPVPVVPQPRLLSAVEFQRLADVPPEIEWFANLGNSATRRAYENALQDFMCFTGIATPAEFRIVTRSHVIAWRDDLAKREPALSGVTVRHRLSSLFDYLCDKNAVTHNPGGGVALAGEVVAVQMRHLAYYYRMKPVARRHRKLSHP